MRRLLWKERLSRSSCRSLATSSLWILAFVLLPAGLAHARVRTFLLGGQSNMAGYGVVAETGFQEDSTATIAIWNAWGGQKGGWMLLGPGFGKDDASFGPERTLGTILARAFPGDTIALVKIAVAATSIAVDWLPPSSGGPGPLYTSLRTWIDAARNAWPHGELPPFEAAFWMQGESDALDSVFASSYQTHLESFIQDVRADRSDPNLPWIVALIDLQPTWPFAPTVRKAQRAVSARLSGVGIVETRGLATDGTHYTAEGQLELGRRLSLRWLSLREGAPDTLPPVDSSGEDPIRPADTTAADTTGVDTTRTDTTSTDTTHTDTTAVDTLATDSTKTDTAAPPHIPVSLERPVSSDGFPPGTCLRRYDAGGHRIARGVVGAQGSSEVAGSGVAIVVAILPDGRIQRCRRASVPRP